MTDGRATVPTGILPISVSTGRSHTCTTNFNNAVQCFGDSAGFGLSPKSRFVGTASTLNVTCGIPLDKSAVVSRRVTCACGDDGDGGTVHVDDAAGVGWCA
jgi:hypothetical protein